MNYKTLIVEGIERITVITLNRQEQLNTITREFIEELEDVISVLDENKNCRVVVLKAKGRVFSAGGDFELLKELDTASKAQALIRRIGRIVKRICEMDKPWIAVVGGVAAGGGANLALACDFIIASQEAKFVQSFVNIGLVPDTGGLWLLSRIVGVPRAKELAMTGRAIDACEAERYGMVLKVVPQEQLEEEAMAFARLLAQKPPLAVGYIKRIANRIGEISMDAYFDMEADLMGIALQTDDHSEGLKAFLEKRTPVFKVE